VTGESFYDIFGEKAAVSEWVGFKGDGLKNNVLYFIVESKAGIYWTRCFDWKCCFAP
jgi:hypothetical protein